MTDFPAFARIAAQMCPNQGPAWLTGASFGEVGSVTLWLALLLLLPMWGVVRRVRRILRLARRLAVMAVASGALGTGLLATSEAAHGAPILPAEIALR